MKLVSENCRESISFVLFMILDSFLVLEKNNTETDSEIARNYLLLDKMLNKYRKARVKDTIF